MKKLLLILIIQLLLNFSAVLADTPTATEEKYLTWRELIDMISKTEVYQKKASSLLDWKVGYMLTHIDADSTAPSIKTLLVHPQTVRPDGKTEFKILAEIFNPDGIDNIRMVKADLIPIGRLPNMKMELKEKISLKNNEGGLYGLENTVDPHTHLGEKEIKISAANQKGWMTLSKINLKVE